MAKKRRLKKPPSKKSKKFAVIDDQQINFDEHPPVFSLKHIRYGGDCCISQCESNDRAYILDNLLAISQLKWKELHSESKKGLGYEQIPQYRFTKPFPPVITPEVRVLIFRYSKEGRIAGFRVNDIFHLIMVGTDLYSH